MNYRDYERVKQLDDMCKMVGLEVKRSTHDYSSNASVFLSVVKEGDQLPVFTRGAELFGGTVEECLAFLSGWIRSSEYHRILFKKLPEDVKKAEQKLVDKYEADRVMSALKTGKDIGWMTPAEDDTNHAPF
jgi:hypothetical protein